MINPAGEVESGKGAEAAAVREAGEETGLTVAAVTGSASGSTRAPAAPWSNVACRVVAGTAVVADPDELADVAWCDRDAFTASVPYRLVGPIQEYLDAALA